MAVTGTALIADVRAHIGDSSSTIWPDNVIFGAIQDAVRDCWPEFSLPVVDYSYTVGWSLGPIAGNVMFVPVPSTFLASGSVEQPLGVIDLIKMRTYYGSIPTIYTFTANSGTDVITATSGTFTDGTTVTFGGNSLPAPLVSDTTYYTVSSSGSTFKVASTSGGTAINLTSNGSGTLTFAVVDGSSMYLNPWRNATNRNFHIDPLEQSISGPPPRIWATVAVPTQQELQIFGRIPIPVPTVQANSIPATDLRGYTAYLRWYCEVLLRSQKAKSAEFDTNMQTQRRLLAAQVAKEMTQKYHVRPPIHYNYF